MPVDFTNKKKQKTNYEYLQEFLSGNAEALEFLEGFKDEKEKEIENLRDEITEKEGDIDEKDTEIRRLEQQKEYADEIDTKHGSEGGIKWESNNLACKTMMEELNEAIGRGVSVLKIENILRAL